MRSAGIVIFVIASLCLINSTEALAACPSADLTGDCFVDFEDFAVIGTQWLNLYDWNDINTLASQRLTTDPCVPNDMVYIPDGGFEMGDSFSEGNSYEQPLHAVLLDAFFMGKYEVTNQQYCDYLNSAYPAQLKVVSGVVYASSDSTNSYPYCNTSTASMFSQIAFSDPDFSVRTKGESNRDMSDDPMVKVSWYGSAAYCNWRSDEEGYESCYNLSTWECDFSKQAYRLATEAEWEYAARGGLSGKRFPWADTNITHSLANYYAHPTCLTYDVNPTEGFHPDCNDGIYPYTSPAGSFSANGFGLYDMAGNVFEWCNDWHSLTYYSMCPYNNPQGPPSGTYRVQRGGCWKINAFSCRVASRYRHSPSYRDFYFGFRIVMDLE